MHRKRLRHILVIFFVDLNKMRKYLFIVLLVGVCFGQSIFNGYWKLKDQKLGYTYLHIFTTSSGQFLEYLHMSDYEEDFSLISTKEIINPWFGKSYTITEPKSKKLNTSYHYIQSVEDSLILYDNQQYETIPRLWMPRTGIPPRPKTDSFTDHLEYYNKYELRYKRD